MYRPAKPFTPVRFRWAPLALSHAVMIHALMDLSAEDQQRVEDDVHRLIADLRARPTQEKEDALGLKVATMPAAEREYVTTVLLRLLRERDPGSA